MLPSGDQSGWVSSVGSDVSWMAVPPPDGISQISLFPAEWDPKTMVLPSGDHSGALSPRGSLKSRAAVPPVDGISQIS